MFLVNPYIYATDAWTNLKSISFDGVDEYVNLGRITMLEGVANFSVSTWIKVDDYSVARRVFGRYKTGTTQTQIGVATSGKINFIVSSGALSYVTSTTVLSTGTWYHVCCVWDASLANANRQRIYINGVLETTVQTGTAPASTDTFGVNCYIGENNAASPKPFDGNIDDTGIFDYSLTGGEVTAIYNSGCPNDLMTLAAAKRPEHYYRFDDITYPTVDDLGETGGKNGTMTNQESGDITTDTPC